MPGTYVEERIKPRIAWYDRRAVCCKRAHMSLQYYIAIASITLVVALHEPGVPRLLLVILAASVAVAATVERIGRFGERWQLNRAAYESLHTEVQLHAHNAGPYAHGDADRLLVERTEAILGIEGARWHSLVGATTQESRERRLPLP